MAAFSGGFTGAVEKIERSIVVTNAPLAADERALFRHFAKCGQIHDVRMVRNRDDNTTGVAIVEFIEDESLARAVSLQPPYTDLFGAPLNVNRADAQLNKTSAQKRIMTRSQLTQQVLSGLKAGATVPAQELTGPNMRKLHIKNLRPVVTEEDMRGIFKPFGEFQSFQMGTNECWITFDTHNDAQDAMGSMQGFQLVGQELQISLQPADVPLVPMVPPPPKPEAMDLQNDSDFGATGAAGGGIANRLEVMKKLAGAHSSTGVPMVVSASGGGTSVTPAPPAAPPAAKPGGPTARTLLLQGMFDPATVNLAKEPKFYEEIREDTHDECQKFGKVLHVTVDPRGAGGLIYVLYEGPAQRQAAEHALNGRWFEGKKIIAQGIDDSIWQALAAQAQGGGPGA